MQHGSPQQQHDPQSAATPQAWPSFMDSSTAVAEQPPAVAPQAAAQPRLPEAPVLQPWESAQQQVHQHVQQHVAQQHGVHVAYGQAPVAAQQQHAPQPGMLQFSAHPQQAAAAPAPPAAYAQTAHQQPHAAQQFAPVQGGGFAYPTPAGTQVVQPAGVPAPQLAHQQFAPQQLAPPVAAQPPVKPARKRMRWEVIVPLGTAIVLMATAALVFTNFDRITGASPASSHSTSSASTDAAGTADDDAMGSGHDGMANTETMTEIPDVLKENTVTAPDPKLSPAEGRAAVAKAGQLLQLGRYDEATATLAPLVQKGKPVPPAVARLRNRIKATSIANDQLLGQLGQQRQAKAWDAVLITLGEIQKLHPLNAEQAKLRATASAQVRASGGGAATTKPAAAAKVPNPKKVTPRAPASPGSTGGGATGGSKPPSGTSTSTAPARPSVANPSAAPSSTGVVSAAQPAASSACMDDHSDMTMHGGGCE